MLTTGTKYEKGMDTAEVAKRVREDIKRSQKAGLLPASMKVSVRISRFSGGSSLDISIKSAPIQIHASDYIAHHVETKGMRHWADHRYTTRALALLAKVEDIARAYQRQDVDSQTDYNNSNFYLHVGFDSELKREDREVLISYYEALQAPRLRLVG